MEEGKIAAPSEPGDGPQVLYGSIGEGAEGVFMTTTYSDWDSTLAAGIDPDSRIAKTIKHLSAAMERR